MTSPDRGEAGPGSAEEITETWIPSSAMTRRIAASTSAGTSSGSMRQLTVARARWGRAFSAWPPSSIVATQVVRSCAL